jgi:hypothetical protein
VMVVTVFFRHTLDLDRFLPLRNSLPFVPFDAASSNHLTESFNYQ